MELTEQSFRALARSSPWRWRSVHLVREVGGPVGEGDVEAVIRRPHLMRVVADGEVHVVRDGPTRVAPYTRDGRSGPVDVPTAADVRPVLDADGLVRVRPDSAVVGLDDPMWQSYDWVAMLDPVELADGSPWRDPATGADVETPPLAPEPYPELDRPTRVPVPGTLVSDLRAGDRHGRATWWARVVPTWAYEPRCSCCPLLPSEVADRLEHDEEGSPFVPGREYPSAHDVALDAATGICVEIHAVGGPRPGIVHDVRIHAVDEAYGDELFIERSRWLPRAPRFRGR
jgi:hypothetical protein